MVGKGDGVDGGNKGVIGGGEIREDERGGVHVTEDSESEYQAHCTV